MSQKSIDIKTLIKPPSDWKLVKLKDIVELKYGYRTSIPRLPPKDGIQIISTAEIKNDGRLNLSKLRRVNILSKLVENYKIKKNDLLFNWRNAQEHIGKVAIVDFQPIEPMIYASFIIRITTSEFVNYRFLHALLTYYRWINIFFKLSGRAVNQANFNANYLGALDIYLPSIPEQQKIASILSKIDELIQKTEQIIHQTQKLKKGLMQRLLTKGIGHTKFKRTELGEIPDSWELVNINQIIKDKDGIKTGPFGSSLKKEIFVLTGYKIYGQENVIPDDFTIGDYFISEEIFLKMKKYEIKPGDILISLVGTHGKVSVVPDNIQRGIINPRLLRIRLDQNKVVPIYMKILLESDYIEKQTKKFAHGLTMGILNTNTIRQFYFVIPSIEEQMKIISIFFIINEKLKNMKDYKSKIELLKKGLMQQLLTGKKRV